jgi:gluconate 2-dehydrogenase gamma chain
MRSDQPSRRHFLIQASALAGAAWIDTQWPAIVAAAQHAHNATTAKTPPRFEVLTHEQARQVEAIAAQIIPTDDQPGAREAGVVYFIDRALKTFESKSLSVYEQGLANLDQLTRTKYPEAKTFADTTEEQQQALLIELESQHAQGEVERRLGPEESNNFFQTIRTHTVLGFLTDPAEGGNRDYTGWKVLGRDPAESFSSPFGYYDKNYPGWHTAKMQAEKI